MEQQQHALHHTFCRDYVHVLALRYNTWPPDHRLDSLPPNPDTKLELLWCLRNGGFDGAAAACRARFRAWATVPDPAVSSCDFMGAASCPLPVP